MGSAAFVPPWHPRARRTDSQGPSGLALIFGDSGDNRQFSSDWKGMITRKFNSFFIGFLDFAGKVPGIAKGNVKLALHLLPFSYPPTQPSLQQESPLP